MKKKILSVILIFALLGCIASCDTSGSDQVDETSSPVASDEAGETSPSSDPIVPSESSESTETKEPQESLGTIYELLNSLSSQNYSKIKLDIKTVTGDVTLNASYVLTEQNVTYSVERLNMLPTDGTLGNASPDCKKTVTGSAVIENGTVTILDGEAISLPTYDELKGQFHFDEDNFANVAESEGLFAADVVSPGDLLGTDRELSDMKISVEYFSSSLKSVTITYQTASSVVTTRYELEK